MKCRFLLLVSIFSLTNPLLALSDKAAEAARRLDIALAEEVRSEKPTTTEPRIGLQNPKAAILPRLREILSKPDSPQFLGSLSHATVYFTSEAVLKNLAILKAEVQIEKDAADKATLAAISDILNRSTKTVQEAKAPADLDAIISELGKYHQRGYAELSSEELRIACQQIDPTLQFVTTWQNYLSAKATNNLEAARNALQSISDNRNGLYLIPRSQILALIKKPSAPLGEPERIITSEDLEKIVADVKSLPDIEKALQELRKIYEQRRDYGSQTISAVTESLQPLEKSYREYLAGLSTNIDFLDRNNRGTGIGAGTIAKLRAELLLLILPKYVGAPAGTVAKPGEDVLQLLDRLLVEARDRGDVKAALLCRRAFHMLKSGDVVSGNDTSAFNAYTAAQNQEAAGQYTLAVISYQTALKLGSDLIPTKIIGQRLDFIRAEHPAEYSGGFEQFLSPPPRTANARLRRNDQSETPNPGPSPSPAHPPEAAASPTP